MKFCSNCFNDTEIKNIINSINNTDVCDIHNVKSEHIYDTDKHDNLVPYFEALVDVYTVASESQIEIDKAKYVRLKYDLLYNWKIFNDVCKPENVHNIVKSICKEKYEESPSLFDNDIVIEELFDLEYKKEYSLLKTYSWDDFKTSLIKNNKYPKILKFFKNIPITIIEVKCFYSKYIYPYVTKLAFCYIQAQKEALV